MENFFNATHEHGWPKIKDELTFSYNSDQTEITIRHKERKSIGINFTDDLVHRFDVYNSLIKNIGRLSLDNGFTPVDEYFDGFEIQPVAVIDRTEKGKLIMEVCEPEDADYWSAYIHVIPDGQDGGVRCIGDFHKKEDAEKFVELLRSIIQFAKLQEGV